MSAEATTDGGKRGSNGLVACEAASARCPGRRPLDRLRPQAAPPGRATRRPVRPPSSRSDRQGSACQGQWPALAPQPRANSCAASGAAFSSFPWGWAGAGGVSGPTPSSGPAGAWVACMTLPSARGRPSRRHASWSRSALRAGPLAQNGLKVAGAISDRAAKPGRSSPCRSCSARTCSRSFNQSRTALASDPFDAALGRGAGRILEAGRVVRYLPLCRVRNACRFRLRRATQWSRNLWRSVGFIDEFVDRLPQSVRSENWFPSSFFSRSLQP